MSRIVLAVDRSEESEYACLLAGRLSAATDAAVTLLHVRLVHHLLQGPISDADRERMEREGQEVLDDRQRRVEEAGGHLAETRLRASSRVDDAVLATVDDVDADLVVLGGRGEAELTRRLLLGSVSESVARHAPCSVLIARRR